MRESEGNSTVIGVAGILRFWKWVRVSARSAAFGGAAGNIPRRCRNCGKFFLAVGRYDTIYCSNVAPGEKKKTCRQVGAHRTEKIKNDSSPIQKEYKRAYNRLKACKQGGTLSVDGWNRKVAEAQRLRDTALAGKMDVAALRRKLGML